MPGIDRHRRGGTAVVLQPHGRPWSLCDSSAAGIEGPRLFADQPLPVGPDWKDVQRHCVHLRTDPQDIRDRAILLLLAGRFALR